MIPTRVISSLTMHQWLPWALVATGGTIVIQAWGFYLHDGVLFWAGSGVVVGMVVLSGMALD